MKFLDFFGCVVVVQCISMISSNFYLNIFLNWIPVIQQFTLSLCLLFELSFKRNITKHCDHFNLVVVVARVT